MGLSQRIYTIPGSVNFLEALADGILNTWGGSPEELADITVLLPNRRACRELQAAFLEKAGGAILLPRIRPLEGEDIDEETDLSIGSQFDLFDMEEGRLPSLSKARRRFLLANLVQKMAAGEYDLTQMAALNFAEELGKLLDQVQIDGCDLKDLEAPIPDDSDLAQHWQITRTFLNALSSTWPDLLKAEQAEDIARYRNARLLAQADAWKKIPPDAPVIAAGTTGSIPATAQLLNTITNLPKGMLVLCGLDLDMPSAVWQNLTPLDAQYQYARLLQALEIDRGKVHAWPYLPANKARPKDRFFNTAFIPASQTHLWQDIEPLAEPLADHLAWVECPSQQQEALSISVILREALEQKDRTAALVTPDRSLAERVKAVLKRWGISINDSAGDRLVQTPVAVCCFLMLDMLEQGFTPVSLLAFLKHPLVRFDFSREEVLTQTRCLEREKLRGVQPLVDLEKIAKDRGGIFTALHQATADLQTCYRQKEIDPVKLMRQTAACLQQILGESLQTEKAHTQFFEALAHLQDQAEGIPAFSPQEWQAVLRSLLAGEKVHQMYGHHPRLAIYGLMEARLLKADTVVLGGLNEETWPPAIEADPWLSRPMREKLKLSPLDKRIGQTALDFVQHLVAPTVVLTRSERVNGSPTVPSRFLLRLQTVLDKVKELESVRARGQKYLSWAQSLEEESEFTPCKPPYPAPPVAMRPTELSATRIETLMSDPYSIYAEKILSFESLEPLNADPGGRERGKIIHDILERYVLETKDLSAPPDYDRLIAIGQEVFRAPEYDRPGVWAFWWPRFENVARWFIDQETKRVATRQDIHLEIRGQISLESGVTLTATADRLEKITDTWHIIDYKTGNPPSRTAVLQGKFPQLPLEALILSEGGFENIEVSQALALYYWQLNGGTPPAKMISVVADNIESLLAITREGVEKLTACFMQADTPYLFNPDLGNLRSFNDYDHLARVQEWEDAA